MTVKQFSHFCSGTAKKQEKKFHTNKTPGLGNTWTRHMKRGKCVMIKLLCSVINRKAFAISLT